MGLFIINFGGTQYLSDILVPSLFIGVAAGTGFSQLVGAAMRDVPHISTPWAAPDARRRSRW